MSLDPRTLADLWQLQQELNARAGTDTMALGQKLRAAEAAGDAAALADVRLEVGRWLKNYLDAMVSECHELQDTLSWKHWYREAKQGRQYQLQDVQNARVEAIDMLFFWMSLCQLLGLEADDVFRLYGAKLQINHRRQDEARTQAEHASHEHENRSVV